jgi:multicomponent Na+:H+ antiporter subunit D
VPTTPHPDEAGISGEGEEPEIREPRRSVPPTTTAVPAVLLAVAVLLGCLPAAASSLAAGARTFTDAGGYRAAVLTPAAPLPPPAAAGPAPADWTATGVLLGLLTAALAVLLAVLAVRRPRPWRYNPLRVPVRGLRRLHSGHLGDYLAWLAVGVAVLCAALAAQT